MKTSGKLKPLAALLIAFPTVGCTTLTAAIDSGCKSFKPVGWSKQDTTKTQRQVVEHNKAYDAICKS